jgi:hypothetical protein
MPSVSLNAHFDGQSIILDEPFEIPTNARLLVTLVPSATDFDRGHWATVAGTGIAGAYGDDEPEYSPADVRRP